MFWLSLVSLLASDSHGQTRAVVARSILSLLRLRVPLCFLRRFSSDSLNITVSLTFSMRLTTSCAGPHPCVRRPGGPPREIAVCCIVEIQLRSTALPRSLPPSSPAHVRGITVAIRILSAVARTLLCGLVNMEDGVRHVHGERHLSALQRKVVNRSLC